MADFWNNTELYLPFDDSAADLSGNGRNGIVTNSPTWVVGKINKALTFVAASSQFVVTSYAGISGTGALTSMFWAKTTDTNASTTASPVINWGSTAAAGQWLQAIQNGVFWGRFVSVTASFGSGLNDGNWHHFAMTKPAGGTCNQIKGYVDGTLLTGTYTSGTTVINLGTTTPVNIATQPANSAYFNGSVDEVRILSRELVQADITAVFAWGPPVSRVFGRQTSPVLASIY